MTPGNQTSYYVRAVRVVVNVQCLGGGLYIGLDFIRFDWFYVVDIILPLLGKSMAQPLLNMWSQKAILVASRQMPCGILNRTLTRTLEARGSITER